MIRRPPRSTLSSSSAASDVYKRQVHGNPIQQSIKVFEDKKHARQWLAYWAIYMILQLIEKIVIFIPMIPLYCLVKLVFCWWLSHYDYFGASYLHEKYIDKHFQQGMLKIQPHIDLVMSKIGKKKPEEKTEKETN
eukprot:TRINITY_DN3236_c0_g1_i9.p2 TRINITY_DN3236_c0_g1~~TRINITY_DN3236_c0_g1_i9.p2  ORF type:complete len:135 (-),score=27.19 TRINITY_DN3236_c0_g1_i9:67-471(-)